MFQHPRASQRAFLGDVAHQENRRTALFGITHQQGCALTHLGHTARCRLQLLGKDRLDRVDHHHLGLFLTGRGNDGFDAGFGHDPQLILGQPQAPRTHGHLLLGFFTGDVQRRHAFGEVAQGLQQNGRLADAGVATDQHHRAIHQTTTQNPVELAGSGGEARNFFDTDFGQGLDLRLLACPAGTTAGGGCPAAFHHGFGERVPGSALTALAGPFGEG
ncbi:hypothetical protein D9M71_374290 [compost metagenome]